MFSNRFWAGLACSEVSNVFLKSADHLAYRTRTHALFKKTKQKKSLSIIYKYNEHLLFFLAVGDFFFQKGKSICWRRRSLTSTSEHVHYTRVGTAPFTVKQNARDHIIQNMLSGALTSLLLRIAPRSPRSFLGPPLFLFIAVPGELAVFRRTRPQSLLLGPFDLSWCHLFTCSQTHYTMEKHNNMCLRQHLHVSQCIK